MCGIAGIINNNEENPSQSDVENVSNALRHRGPDAQGIVHDKNTCFIHRRLSIIDTTETGAQPMYDRKKRYIITYNGEIYNYKEIKKKLLEKGVQFRGESDTEVLLEAYILWGIQSLEMLEGMFAFSIWDREKEELLIARDAMGEKPLFYTHKADGSFIFASEIKAIQNIHKSPIDMSTLRSFIGLQYIPSPQTGFENVRQLLPGHYALWKKGELSIKKYYHPKPYTGDLSPDALKELLAISVKERQLASDVPVGAFLSGGIDSATVVALASQKRKMHTFTMGFEEHSFDERKEAQALAKRYNTIHHEYEATSKDLMHIADEVIGHYDAPYADSSALPVWLLSAHTKQEVKVVLTGDGSDELFGGYRRYMFFKQAILISKLPTQRLIEKAIHILGKKLHRHDLIRMSRLIEALRIDKERAYVTLFSGAYFDPTDTQRFFQKEWLESTKNQNTARCIEKINKESNTDDLLIQALSFDLQSYLPDDLLVKMDRATMRWGLEARAPFLDSRIIAFAQALNTEQKITLTNTKVFLKESLKDVLPQSVLTRKKKGFQVPLAQWFRGPMKAQFEERCLDPQNKITGIVNQKEIVQLLKENSDGTDHGNRLWMLYSLATWLENNK